MLLGRIVSLVFAATMLAACVIGEAEEPGCQVDADCGNDRVCRAGACFRLIGDVDASTEDAG